MKLKLLPAKNLTTKTKSKDVFSTFSDIYDEATKKFPADLATFTEKILNGKLHFLCGLWRK